ncbi:protein DMP2-like [Cicer arietinum]|uniref:Protein DMP2-like n=1 Tax=Cicer arietinum TaxID=3827 RepID=A0A1S2YQG6_CICAR|nr:protein DMP2-like [Cicer arietinum]
MDTKNENETTPSRSPLLNTNTETTTPTQTPQPTTTSTTQKSGTDSIGSLIKLLPTGTVFLFQFLNPVVTNSGHCKTSNKYLSSILLAICGFNCIFSTFTDSYTGTDNKRHYGLVTPKGLWPSEASNSIDLSKYKLKVSDFVHAVLSWLIFAVLGLLDTNTVLCFYPSFMKTQKTVLQVLPVAIGVVVGWVFSVFPQQRHGIGYPPSTDSTETTSTISSNGTSQIPTNNV